MTRAVVETAFCGREKYGGLFGSKMVRQTASTLPSTPLAPMKRSTCRSSSSPIAAMSRPSSRSLVGSRNGIKVLGGPRRSGQRHPQRGRPRRRRQAVSRATYPLTEVADSQRTIMTGHITGKIVVVPSARMAG
jgi:hypothetical protein